MSYLKVPPSVFCRGPEGTPPIPFILLGSTQSDCGLFGIVFSGQSAHAPTDVDRFSAFILPGGQGVHAGDPSWLEYVPASQDKQKVVPSLS